MSFVAARTLKRENITSNKIILLHRRRDSVSSGWAPEDLSSEDIDDGEAYHRALYPSGDVGAPSSWHRESVGPLIDLALPHITHGSVVVDYGTGTGASAIELLKKLDDEEIRVDMILVDPLVSWFSKAWDLLGDRDDVHFELSILTDADGNASFRDLREILGGRKADVIISSSTLHLVPARAMGGLAEQFAESLAEGGVLVWDSGDLESGFRPGDSALLHDPYRRVREILRTDDQRESLLAMMSDEDRNKSEKRLDRIFPLPFSIEVITDALGVAGFSSEISEKVVRFSNDDAERFVLVPRLAEIAAPLLKGLEREDAIKRALKVSLEELANQGKADGLAYRSHWIYGCHRRGFD